MASYATATSFHRCEDPIAKYKTTTIGQACRMTRNFLAHVQQIKSGAIVFDILIWKKIIPFPLRFSRQQIECHPGQTVLPLAKSLRRSRPIIVHSKDSPLLATGNTAVQARGERPAIGRDLKDTLGQDFYGSDRL